MKKQIEWGHIWKTSRSKLFEEIALWWPTLGHNWTIDRCLKDYVRAKEEGLIGKSSKIKIYRVVLEEIELE